MQNNNNKKSMLKGEVAIIKLYLNSDSDTIENIYVTYNEGSSVLNKAQGNDTIPTVVWIIGIIVIIFGINYLLGVLIILLRIKKGKNLLQWERTKLMRDILRSMLLIRRELYLNINSEKVFNEEEQFWDYSKKIDWLHKNSENLIS